VNLALRPMTQGDLASVSEWLRAPHVARWWTEDPDDEIADYRRCISGTDPTRALMICVDGRAVGWCQWYRWADYPEAAEYGAGPLDAGIDYAIGEASLLGRGVGTAMIAALIHDIRGDLPAATVLVAVDARNAASRRVLEKNGFVLVELRNIPSEPEDLSALYRLSGASGRSRWSVTRGPR
jgi:aminoglycoside 6'-N-acetyltransferase